jgi:hypothetical protein
LKRGDLEIDSSVRNTPADRGLGHVPTVMLFVPSKDGISHNPAEFSRVEDVAGAAALVERLIRRPTLRKLNALDRPAFVAAAGGVFEHSPWIAERAWGKRPFASVTELLERLCGVVRAATADEQIGLIRAAAPPWAKGAARA